MEIGKNNRIEQTPIHNLNLPANPHGYWLFGSLDFQSGNMISSQPRYDHFDTAAYQIVRTQIRITVSILLAFFRSAAHTRARKPLGDIAFLLLARPADVAISSQARYDHFDTLPYRIFDLFNPVT